MRRPYRSQCSKPIAYRYLTNPRYNPIDFFSRGIARAPDPNQSVRLESQALHYGLGVEITVGDEHAFVGKKASYRLR